MSFNLNSGCLCVILEVSGFHKIILDSIISNYLGDNVLRIALPRWRERAGIVKYFFSRIICIYHIIRILILRQKVNIFIPHPLHLWCSIFYRISNFKYIYDDGSAYYLNSLIPDKFLVKIYLMIAGGEARKNMGRYPDALYGDFLNKDILGYFSLFPELVSTAIPSYKITLSNFKKEVVRSMPILLLDTDNDESSLYSYDAICDVLRESMRRQNSKYIYIKSHPKGPSALMKKLLIDFECKVIIGVYEELLLSSCIRELYVIYSSAAISTKLIDPNVEVFNFSTTKKSKFAGQLTAIYENLGIRSIFV